MKIKDSISRQEKDAEHPTHPEATGAIKEPGLVVEIGKVEHENVWVKVPAKQLRLCFTFDFHGFDRSDNFLENLEEATTFDDAWDRFGVRSRINESWVNGQKLDVPPPNSSEALLERFYNAMPLSMDEHYAVREVAFQAFLAEARKRMAASKPSTIVK